MIYSAVFYILVMSILFPISSEATTYSGEWADVWFYFSWMEEDGSWHEWVEITDENESILYSNLYLKVGQPVKCKIKAITHIECVMSFTIYEPGVTKAFDVVEGNNHDETIRYGVDEGGIPFWLDTETKKEYTWILQTNDNWTGGRAPLNGFCQVNDQYTTTDNLKIDLSFANPYIENEQWTGPSYTPDNNNGDGDSNGNGNNNNNDSSTPGFELAFVFIAFLAVVFSLRKKKENS